MPNFKIFKSGMYWHLRTDDHRIYPIRHRPNPRCPEPLTEEEIVIGNLCEKLRPARKTLPEVIELLREDVKELKSK